MAQYDDASQFSDLSSLDGSDDFGRKLLQHTKDAQRISTLQSHAFRKAKPLPRAALNLDNLERNNLDNPPAYLADHYHPPSLTGSSASDPPLNPPRAWGRKGRTNHAWMRQIHDASQSSPNIDWADAANDSLHPSAYASPSQIRANTASAPPAAQQHDNYVDQWDPDQDFSAASLLASTPAVPSRSRLTIDQIREREVSTIESRPFASTHRQAWQQSTSETVSRRYQSIDAQSAVPSPSVSAQASKPNISNKENIPLEPRHSARSLYKTADRPGPIANVTPGPAQRRADSMALLKRLSRTPSASPSPTSAQDAVPSRNSLRPETAWSDKYPKAPIRSLFQGNSPQAPEVVRGPEPVHVISPGDSSQAPEVVEAPEQNNPAPLITPSRPAERQLPAKTPVVMGAWVDTPQTARQSSNSAPSGSDSRHRKALDPVVEDMHPRTISEPNLPASALDAVLKDIREGKRKEEDDPTLGDSTIASLEEVMNPSADTTTRLDLPNVPSVQPQSSTSRNDSRADSSRKTSKQDLKSVDAAPTTQEQRDQRKSWFALEGLKKRLAGTSAKPQPNRQTQGNGALDDAIASALTNSRPSSNRIGAQHTHRDVIDVQCVQCGRPTSVFRAAWNEYWSLYFRRDRHSPLGFRFTWLGLACAIFWSWLFAESILSAIVSPPKYAYKMRGYGVDPDAPRFPYVLTTLAFRPFSPVLSPLASTAAWLWTSLVGRQQYKYYPASPGAWGSAGRVKIGPPGPRSAYSTGNYAADHVVWKDEQTTAQAWHTGDRVQKTNIWSDSQAWEAQGDGSMLDDELI